MATKHIVEEEIVYEEFEPLCKWQRKEDRDVLEVHLQDFKKEQLKVQISNHGVLKISGERQINSSKHTKFYKEVAAPSTKYDTHAIHAKFVNNTLIITLPKPKPSSDHHVAPSEPSKVDHTPKIRFAEQAPANDQVGGNIASPLQSCLKKEKKKPLLAKVAASLAATVVVALVLAAYMHLMYKSTVDRD